jgi:hypothetical protein
MRRLAVALAVVALTLGGLQAADAALAPWTANISSPPAMIDAGQSVKITGSVSPNAKGKWVQIEHRRPGGRWQTIKSGPLDSYSRIYVTTWPQGVGRHYYRVHAVASGGRAGDYSPVRTVTVMGWFPLTSFEPTLIYPMPGDGGDARISYNTDITMGGVSYPHSIGIHSSNISWRLGSCDRLRMEYGIIDAPFGAIILSSDDNVIWWFEPHIEYTPPGSMDYVSLIPGQTFKFYGRAEDRDGPPAEEGLAVLGSPTVRCPNPPPVRSTISTLASPF